jgi:hypothetical protein
VSTRVAVTATKAFAKSMTVTEIQLPPGFTAEHEQAVINYLAGNLQGRKAWQAPLPPMIC